MLEAIGKTSKFKFVIDRAKALTIFIYAHHKTLALMRKSVTNTFLFSTSVGWWSNYSAETPNLQMMAMKILSLTSSSSGCERNWSTFEGIHTKKRNRLYDVRMSHLVYVQFNSKLSNKKKKMKEKYDVLVANGASMAQGWIVDGGDDDKEPSLDSNITSEDIGEVTGRIVRELDEEDFQSDDEVNNNENLIFDFDDSDQQGW
ncbi:hypothetical protein POM88_050950 [Heracleum sosnowskyi]|uniref:HAT C-terminal dimerisation domain-containing protein n=1 Tax=Heracleum sosnowskyi TaxID=360622 RepID=A0AAD8M2Y2_9APIA|nr:hypothetical protein POM88_050950 [Heracleum sosnowskyi]